ncbi:MAG: hypothetical protein ACJ8G3_23815 [Burkholderiaceae bacterium]
MVFILAGSAYDGVPLLGDPILEAVRSGSASLLMSFSGLNTILNTGMGTNPGNIGAYVFGGEFFLTLWFIRVLHTTFDYSAL